ncbi:MAG TPA: phosphodiesterase [Solirubrobacteraceae bacterium]|nr:phosphodiesterase [Solirubrobacteraceae bacterium]
MSKPFLLVQLSDPHIGATWTRGDPAARWQAAIESVASLPDRADAVLVSGDLVEHGTDDEYAVVKSALDALDLPAHVLAGNHDDRARLREQFRLGGEADEPVHYAVDLGPVRLVVLDTTWPGRDSGQIDGRQLEWLEAELAAAPDETTVLAMHHPPFATGMRAWDAIGLAPPDRAALGDVVGRHRNVVRMVAGHVHCPLTGELAGCVALSAPSTYVQARPRFEADELELSDESAAFAIHAVRGTEVVSFIQPVTLPE